MTSYFGVYPLRLQQNLERFKNMIHTMHLTSVLITVYKIRLLEGQLCPLKGSYIPRQPDAFAIPKAIIENGDKSYFVEFEALMAIGNAKEQYSLGKLTQALEKTGTFIDIIPLGAIEGLKTFADKNKDERTVASIACLFINKSKYGN